MGELVRLQGSWRFYETPDGIEVCSPTKGARFRVSGLDPNRVLQLLGALAGGVSTSDLPRNLSAIVGLAEDSVVHIVGALESHGALIHGQPVRAESDGRFDRQLRFFRAFETDALSAEVLHGQLVDRRVVVFGLGGYGSWLVSLFARMGVRRIIGVDPDTVELSNMNRQVLYHEADIGRSKATVCQERIREIDPEIEFTPIFECIDSAEQVQSMVAGADLVMNAFGYIVQPHNPILEHIARGCVAAGVPSLLFSGSWLGPLNLPGKTACYFCLRDDPLLESARASFPASPTARIVPSFAPRMAMTAATAVWEAARFLSGIDRPPSLDGVVVLDTFGYTHHGYFPMIRDVRCPVCGEERSS